MVKRRNLLFFSYLCREILGNMVEEFTFTYEEKQKMAAQTAEILTEEIGLKGDAIQAVHLIPEIEEGHITMEEVGEKYGPSVVRILEGLDRIVRMLRWRVRISGICFCRLPRICG